MLSRTREIVFRSGSSVATPLLVPSLSSRGFNIGTDGLSEVASSFLAALPNLTDGLLVSAYDLHHRLVPEATAFLAQDHWDTSWATPQFLIIDSGGYELGLLWDGTEVRQGEREPFEFSKSDYYSLVDALPGDMDIILVSWDHIGSSDERMPIRQQIEEAAALRERAENVLLDALIKPEIGDKYIRPERVLENAKELGKVDIVGFTEKELGESIADRAYTLATIRAGMDLQGISAPIHVFGVLDPIFIRAYFACGAEIFDGLTWLRYGIHSGISLYREAASLMSGDIHFTEPARILRQQLRYLEELKRLQRDLRQKSSGGKYSVGEMPTYDQISRVLAGLVEDIQQNQGAI